MSDLTSHESFVLSVIRFVRAYGRESVRPYGRTDVSEKIRDVPENKSFSSRKVGGKKCRPRRCRTYRFCARVIRVIRPAYSSGLRVTGEQIHNVPENKSLMGKLIGQFYKKSRYEISKTVRHGLYGRGTIAKSRGTITTECDRLDKFRSQFCWAKIGQKTPFSARKKIRFRKRIIC